MMSSLRARLIALLLVVAAGGMLALAAATYAEQRSFLLERVDNQLETAVPAMEHELLDGGRGEPQPRGGGGPPRVGLPPGTYGELRDASGAVVGDPFVVSYAETRPAVPDLPRDLPANGTTTVPAEGGGEPQFRVFATPLRGGTGTIVVAVPLLDLDDTLDRLLLVEGIVIAGTTAGIIAGGDMSRRVSPATSRTEVGRLGLALNAMLDRLEEAFARRQESEDRLRRFLSDASHELRTPLASIRGYAELFRMGAARDPADVDKAMRRIEEEAARMGVLVEDLLALARLDEEREPVRRSVDVAALARDAVADARATAPDREIALTADAGADVLADPDQLGQVLANLLRNAIVHTPAGTPIEVAVERGGGDVRLRVRDHGPGLPDGDPAALFERFWRAEGGRERGKAGAGLGLAIVAGIVAAHHGTVSAEDAAGGGACFTVRLPAALGGE
jgi:two-component system OmpR family sensor kinase